jgi:hypothetical protein
MTTPASPPPGVYHSRSRITRNRLALAAAGLALVLLGYLLGRLQGGSDTPAAIAAPPPPSAAAPASPAPEPEPSTAATSTATSTAPQKPGIDAYALIQAEAASGQQGTEFQDTEDEGGGQNAGWISNGDWLRFDDVDFGDTPATTFAARVASDVGDDRGGRMEIRIDSPGNEPVGVLEVTDTDGWQTWQSRATDIRPTTGRHTVFVTFAGEGDTEFMNLNYFAFAH